jgi:hypothetical protein
MSAMQHKMTSNSTYADRMRLNSEVEINNAELQLCLELNTAVQQSMQAEDHNQAYP